MRANPDEGPMDLVNGLVERRGARRQADRREPLEPGRLEVSRRLDVEPGRAVAQRSTSSRVLFEFARRPPRPPRPLEQPLQARWCSFVGRQTVSTNSTSASGFWVGDRRADRGDVPLGRRGLADDSQPWSRKRRTSASVSITSPAFQVLDDSLTSTCPLRPITST